MAGTDASWAGQLGGSPGARPGGAGGIWLAPVAGDRPLDPGAGGRPLAGGVADTGFQVGAGASPDGAAGPQSGPRWAAGTRPGEVASGYGPEPDRAPS